jgi:hypothetical protein
MTDYQCVLVGEVWHLTQEQAVPPSVLRDGAWTSCAVWAGFKRGYNRRRPDCPECLRHVMEWEAPRGVVVRVDNASEMITVPPT